MEESTFEEETIISEIEEQDESIFEEEDMVVEEVLAEILETEEIVEEEISTEEVLEESNSDEAEETVSKEEESSEEKKETVVQEEKAANPTPMDLAEAACKKAFEEGRIAGLQEAIIAIMECNGYVTPQMRSDVYNQTHIMSLINWIKSFRQ